MRSLFLKIFLWFWATQILIGIALSLLTLATSRNIDQQYLSSAGTNLEARANAAAIAYEAGGKPSLKALQEAWQVPRRRFQDDDGPDGPRGRGGEPPNDGGPGGPPPDEPPGEMPPNDGPRPDDDNTRGRDGFRGDRRSGRYFRGFGGRFGGPDNREFAAFYLVRGKEAALDPQRLVGNKQPDFITNLKFTSFTNGQALITQSDDDMVWLARLVSTARGGRYMAAMPLRFPSGRWRFGALGWLIGGPEGPWRIVVIAFTMGIVCYALARYLTDPAIKLRRATQEFASGNLSARVGPQMGRRRDELADLGRDFDVMAERIENLLLSERRLLGDISHELRSPLARMQVALDLADQGADEQTRAYLGRIEEEAKELNAMINQLLTITRLENATRSEQPEEMVDLEQLVGQVCANADFEARSLGGKVEFVEKTPCRVRGNGQLLRSAIENVVRNAIVHAPGPQGVQISLQDAGNIARICVRDHGPGVPPEALTELFRPFYRVAEDRDRQTGGVGLGLSITQRAILLHGGNVVASNAPDGGLIVEMTLPLNAN